MNCNEFLSRFSEYYDDGLDSADRDQFEAHRAGCVECGRYVDVVRNSIQVLNAMKEVEPTDSFRARLSSRIDEERAVKRMQVGIRGSGASTGAVVAVALLFAAIAWAPSLRLRVGDFTLPTIVVAAPAPANSIRRSTAAPLFKTLSPYATVARPSELWGNTSTLLREYSHLRGRASASGDAVVLRTLGFE